MKKLKIIVPAVALIMVLAFSITIGVYAASSSSLIVNSQISFVSPDLSVKIDCYYGEDTSGTPAFEYPNSNGTDAWTIDSSKIVFSKATEGDNYYNPAHLTFVITNNTVELDAYSYFTRENETTVIKQDTLDATETADNTKVVEDLLNVAFEDSYNTAISKNGGTTTVKITFTINESVASSKNSQVEFLYKLFVDKTPGVLPTE